MLKQAIGALLLFVCLLSPMAKAYDVDTHFYATYAMARYSGIGHDVAAKIATYAQWMDETYLSSPMIPTVVLGTKIRRLLHFPCTEKAGDFSASSFLGYKTLSETVPNHPVASELIMEGMQEGWLMKSAAGLHVIEDSYAHAGTPAEIGHSMFWHWPDRPYAATSKYYEMVQTVLKVMVAIRGLLPEEALDVDLHDRLRLKQANYKSGAIELALAYSSIPEVKQVVEKNIMKDVSYVSFALNFVLTKAQKEFGYIVPNANLPALIKKFNLPLDGEHDTREVLKAFAKAALAYEQVPGRKSIFNKEKMLSKYGFVTGDPDYIKSWGSLDELIEAVVTEMMQGQIPLPLSEKHKVEVEVEGPIREKEMELRISNVRHMITKLFGIDVRFTDNPVRHYYDRKKHPGLEPKTPYEVVVTLNYEEQALWNRMIFSFLFPDADYPSDAPFTYFLTLGESPWVAWDALTARLTPKKENRYYQNPELFQKLKELWTVKRLISKKAVHAMQWHTVLGNSKDKTGILY